MQQDQTVGFGRHECLPYPQLSCLTDAEIDGGRWIGSKYFALQFGTDLVIYDEDGVPTDLTLDEAVALAELDVAGCGEEQVHKFMNQSRWARDSKALARRGIDQMPASPSSLEMCAAYAWYIKILSEQGDALAAKLLSLGKIVFQGFKSAAAVSNIVVAALPVRPAALIGGRALAALTLTQRLLAQRPNIARALRVATS